jgi:acetyltransferase
VPQTIPPARAALESLFRPRSIAVVGASNTPGKRGHVLITNLAKIGYAGRILPIHPGYPEVLGHRCYRCLEDLPEAPDVVAVCLAAAAVPEVVERCGALGVKAMAVVAAGFADAGPEGAALQARMLDAAARHGIHIMGPNGIGIVNRLDRVQYWMSSPRDAAYAETAPSGVSCVLQSGALGLTVTTDGLERGLALDYVVSAGSQVSLDIADYIDWMLEDARSGTKVIGAILEGIVKPDAFRQVARRALAKGVALVVLKSGRSAATGSFIASHTGALVGAADVADQVFAREGVIAVRDMDEWTEQIVLHAHGRRPRGDTWFMQAPSGGGNAICIDIAEEIGLAVPPATEVVTRAMREIGDRPVLNPFDSGGYYDAKGVAGKALRAAIADPAVDAVVGWLSMWPEATRGHNDILKAFAEAAPKTEKPVVMFSFTAGPVGDHARSVLRAGGLYPLKGARASMLALKRWLWWHAKRRSRREAAAHALPAIAMPAKGGSLHPDAARALLSSAGLALVPTQVVVDGEAAAAYGAARGGPIVLKLEHPDLLHKTEHGAVAVNLADPARIRAEAGRLLALRARIGLPDATLVAQDMLQGGAELLLAARHDAVFGPHVVVGLGGVMAELFRDVSLRPAPVTPVEAGAMLRELKGFALLDGFRGGARHDLAAVADAIHRLSLLAAALGPRLDTIELNPVIALPGGGGAFAVDVVAALA